MTGMKIISVEQRAKISASLKGRKRGFYSKAHCKAISDAKKGKPASPAMLAALELARAANTGRKPWNKGKRLGPQSAKMIEKRVAPLRGRKRDSRIGRKISEARMGMKFSNEHKANLSKGQLARWARGDANAWRSKLEKSIEWLLASFGFTPQFRFEFGSSHPYDYGNRETKTLIEVHGCYWHAHGCDWIKRQPINAEKVRSKDAWHEQYAQGQGFRVISLWQCQEKQWPMILKTEGIL